MFLRHNNIFADEVRNQCVWIIEWYLCALCCVHKCSTIFCSSWFSPMDVTVVFKRDRSSVIWTMGINLWWSRTGRDLWVILSLFLLSLHSQFIKKPSQVFSYNTGTSSYSLAVQNTTLTSHLNLFKRFMSPLPFLDYMLCGSFSSCVCHLDVLLNNNLCWFCLILCNHFSAFLIIWETTYFLQLDLIFPQCEWPYFSTAL